MRACNKWVYEHELTSQELRRLELSNSPNGASLNTRTKINLLFFVLFFLFVISIALLTVQLVPRRKPGSSLNESHLVTLHIS